MRCRRPVRAAPPCRRIFTRAKSAARVWRSPHPFKTELGGTIKDLTILWEEWGSHNERTVLVCPSLSVGSHASSSAEDTRTGWWESMIGSGAAAGIDTDHFRIICPSGLGAPYGTTSPLSLDASGKRIGRSFPQITPRDIARCHHLLLQQSLGIKNVHAVVGASLGGMVALCFAASFPDVAQRILAIACTARSSPGSVALRSVQRQAILSDPNYQDGNYYDTGRLPVNGMRLARQLGMITYRSFEEFNARFSWLADKDPHFAKASFDVERYLQQKGDSFAQNYDPNCYLLLSTATDLMDMGRGYSSLSEGILHIGSSPALKPKILLIGSKLDGLIPVTEMQHLAILLESHRRDVTFKVTHSIYGHDAFLLDDAWFVPRIRAFLEDLRLPLT